MDQDVQNGTRTETGAGGRALWRAPTLTEYDIASSTEITNCGNGADGFINFCLTAPS